MSDLSNLKIVLTGGGTAGHIIPLLGIWEAIRSEDGSVKIFYFGGGGRLERELLGDAQLNYTTIPSGPLNRFFSIATFFNFFKSIAGFFVAFFRLLKLRPQVILAKGGFVALPVALAGKLLGIKIVIHESDVVLGLTNRILAPLAKNILIGFPDEKLSTDPKFIFTGNPLPKIFTAQLSQEKKKIFDRFKLSASQKLILVFGGGRGARALNQIVVENLQSLLDFTQVALIAGVEDYDYIKSEKLKLPPEAADRFLVFSFLKEIPALLAIADLVVSRAGAGSISAIALFGKSTIFIPYPYAAANHQFLNAKALADKEACRLISQKDLTKDVFLRSIKELLGNHDLRLKFQKNIKQFAAPAAAQKIAKLVIDLAGS